MTVRIPIVLMCDVPDCTASVTYNAEPVLRDLGGVSLRFNLPPGWTRVLTRDWMPSDHEMDHMCPNCAAKAKAAEGKS